MDFFGHKILYFPSLKPHKFKIVLTFFESKEGKRFIDEFLIPVLICHQYPNMSIGRSKLYASTCEDAGNVPCLIFVE